MRARLPLLALSALLCLVGCSGNKSSQLLVPTGIRPAPAVPTGALTGVVVFDTTAYPGLGQPPFPPARVQMTQAGLVVAETLTTPGSPTFTFTRLKPGDYGLVVRSHAFSPRAYGPFRVVDRTRDAGDLALAANTADSLASNVFVIGTMPGYTTDELATFTTLCIGTSAGLWRLDNDFNLYASPLPTVAAGTHRLKFVTDASSTPGNLIGWGGDGAQTLEAPFENAPARFGTTPASDLVVHFATTDTFAFIFDERRLSISIVEYHAPGTAALRSAMRARSVPPRRLP
jgi:hypothetical protein